MCIRDAFPDSIVANEIGNHFEHRGQWIWIGISKALFIHIYLKGYLFPFCDMQLIYIDIYKGVISWQKEKINRRIGLLNPDQ